MIIENINVKDSNIEEIVKTYKLDKDLLLDVQDTSEIARFLEKSNYTEVILKYPVKSEVCTLGVYITKDSMLLLHTDDFPFEIDINHKTTLLVLVDIINKITESYFKLLKNVDKKIKKIKSSSKIKIKNSSLLSLFELQNDLDDYVMGIKGNLIVIEKILQILHDNEFVNEVKIENNQALGTALSYSKTVSNLKSTLEIITNNLTNKRMESLTIVNVSALIITSISGLYGMNVRLPFA
ncbi:MAG: hypothetical protein IJ638_00165, partial [Alphaproteobacteria bacterium]|nr:hypothetical protein [Alphaproteobacteria bacterium]